MDTLGFDYVRTPVKSPQYNGGVEESFSMAKGLVKKMRLQALMEGDEVDLNRIVPSAFNQLEPHYIAKCVVRSLELLNLNIN